MFSDLQLKVAAQSAVDACHAEIAPLTLFSHSYNSEIDGVFGSAIAVPTTSLSAGDFDVSVGYKSTNEFGGELVNLDYQPTTSLRISDKNLAYTGIDFAKSAGMAIGKAIGRACFKKAVERAETTTLTATLNLSAVMAMPELALKKDMPVGGSVAIVSPEVWTAVMKDVGAYQIYGGTDMIQKGIARNVLGFSAIIPTSVLGTNTKGLIIPENALGTVCRYLPPVFDNCGTNTKVNDDEYGFVFGLREFVDAGTGYGYVAGTTLFGAKKLDKILKLV